MREALLELYARMAARYGPTGWWPGETPFEIAIGAILTQNTAWTNVEKAITRLKHTELLDPRAMLACDGAVLEEAIRPSGYFRVKAERLRAFCAHLVERYDGAMAGMAERPLDELREELLALKGVGPETADDILLYACGKPIFVVDAYTRRILSRHGLCAPRASYAELQELFHDHLEANVALFKEFHGLLVWTGKDYCKKRPQCAGCPLEAIERVDAEDM